jgi:hypothetical protein
VRGARCVLAIPPWLCCWPPPHIHAHRPTHPPTSTPDPCRRQTPCRPLLLAASLPGWCRPPFLHPWSSSLSACASPSCCCTSTGAFPGVPAAALCRQPQPQLGSPLRGSRPAHSVNADPAAPSLLLRLLLFTLLLVWIAIRLFYANAGMRDARLSGRRMLSGAES